MYPFYALVLGLLSCVSGQQSDLQNVLATGDAALHAVTPVNFHHIMLKEGLCLSNLVLLERLE